MQTSHYVNFIWQRSGWLSKKQEKVAFFRDGFVALRWSSLRTCCQNSSSRGPEAASLRQLSEFIADGSWDQDHLLVPLVCPDLLWCIFFCISYGGNLLNSQAPPSPASWVLMLRSAVLKQNHRWILTDEKQFAEWVNHLKKWLNKHTHKLCLIAYIGSFLPRQHLESHENLLKQQF